MATSSVSIGARHPPALIHGVRRAAKRGSVRSITRTRASASAEDHGRLRSAPSDSWRAVVRSGRPRGPMRSPRLAVRAAGPRWRRSSASTVCGVPSGTCRKGRLPDRRPCSSPSPPDRLDTTRCDYGRGGVRLGRSGSSWPPRFSPRGQRVVVIERGPLRGTRPGDGNMLAPRAGVPRAPRRPHPGPVRRGDNQGVQPHPMRVLRRRVRGTVRGREFHRAPRSSPRISLNTGVKPSLLLDAVRGNFEAKGGVVLEKTAISGISGPGPERYTAGHVTPGRERRGRRT